MDNSTEIPSSISIANYYIGVYGQLAVAVSGLTGNVLAFLTFRHYDFQTPSMLYLQALTLADLNSLFWDSIVATVLPQLGVPTESSSKWMCKVGMWHNISSSVVSSWSLMAVAIDRTVALNCSTFHKTRCTRKFAMAVIVCLWVVVYICCTPAIYFYDYSPGHCTISGDGNAIKKATGTSFSLFIDFGALFSLPLLGIVVSNIFILKKLKIRKQFRNDFTQNYAKDASTKPKDENEILWLLFADSCAFFILVILVGIFCLCCVVDQKAMPVYTLIGVLCSFMSSLEEAIRFYLYIVFSRKFRLTFFKMMQCGRPSRVGVSG